MCNWGNNSWWWIIILLLILGWGNNGCGCGCDNGCNSGCGYDNIWWIIILLLILGGGFNNCGCDNGCGNNGCGCGNNGCGNNGYFLLQSVKKVAGNSFTVLPLALAPGRQNPQNENLCFHPF